MTHIVQPKPGEPFIPAPATKSYMDQRRAIFADLSASFWIREAILTLERRDPVDAVADVEVLLALAMVRMKDVFQSAPK